MSTPTRPLHLVTSGPTPPDPARPEVLALLEAIENPIDLRCVDGTSRQVIVLDHLLAIDLGDLIEDLCTATGSHRRCNACGESVACHPCGLGDVDAWCLHHNFCPDCRYKVCTECKAGPQERGISC